MTNTVLSIIMPSYNRPEELKVMVDSIIASTLSAWELIIVDDGSEEETMSLLKSYSQADSRIKLHPRKEEPKGAQTCRNLGVTLATGKYIIFFDSDDYITPECLARRVDTMEQHPELDFMVFPSASMDHNGLHETDWCNNYGYPVYSDDIEAIISRRLPFVVWNNIYRRSSLEQKSIKWDVQLHSFQDSDFNLSALLSGMRYGYATESPNFYYRIPDKNRNNASIVTEMYKKERHLNSHVYLTRKWTMILKEGKKGKYADALYDGAIFIIRFHHETSSSWKAGHLMCQVLKDYSYWMHMKLAFHIRLGEALQKFLSPRLSFTLAFLTYKMRDWIKAKKRIRKLKQIYQSQNKQTTRQA